MDGNGQNNNGGGANNGAGNGNGGGDGGANTNNQNGNQNGNGSGGAGGQGNGAGAGNGGNNGQGGNDNQNQNGSGVQLTPEQLQAAFEHPRFKELNEKAKLADKLKSDQEAAEKKRLEEAGEHQKLAEQYKGEADTFKTQLETERKTNALINAAMKIGAHDPAVVAKLVDAGSITIGDDGTVSGVDEAIKALQQSNAYLFKTGSTTQVGGGDTNSSGNGNSTEFSATQFKDAAFYKEHQAAMDKAMTEGRVDMTR